MAGKKITEINNPVTTLTGNELQEIVQVGVTKTVTPTNQKEFNQAQLKHDSFSDVATAGTGVDKGHVKNDYPLQIPELTTTERDALTPVEGMLIFNTTDSEFQKYIGTTWETDYNSGNANKSTVDWAAKILNVAEKITVAGKDLLKQTSEASSATPTPTGDARENEYYLTALEEDATFAAPSGTPANGNTLIIRIKDDGTARTIDWNEIYRAVGVTLPLTTVISKTMYVGAIYNSADSKWDVTSVIQEA